MEWKSGESGDLRAAIWSLECCNRQVPFSGRGWEAQISGTSYGRGRDRTEDIGDGVEEALERREFVAERKRDGKYNVAPW